VNIKALIAIQSAADKDSIQDTPSQKALIDLAEDDAMYLGHPYIGTEHLLLAVIRASDKSLGEILKERGVGLIKTRTAVIKILGGNQSTDVYPSIPTNKKSR
jgi:ATP-dependent Clp protease ATP-binding subunit ClpC